MAFLSIFPNTEGFSVVITKEHHPSYAFDASDQILSDLVLASRKVGKLLDASFDDVGRTGMFFEGFGVDHLHTKLSPMHGTATIKRWKPIESGANVKVFYKQYPGYLSSHDAIRAEDEKLAKLASRIKATSQKLKK